MGADIKSLRNRIKSVRSTAQLTNAMGLVASSKIRRAQEARVKSGQYKDALCSIVDVLTLSEECKKSFYITPPKGSNKTKIILIAGDRGLAGGYNANIFRFVKEMGDVDVFPIGKKACERYKSEIISSERFTNQDALLLAKTLCEEFKSAEYEKIGIVYTKYVSMIAQEPSVEWILPLTSSGKETKNAGAVFEPSEIAILESSVPIYVAGLIYETTREAFACEVVARRNAMDSAGKNAKTMIDSLQLQYNRARQGAITQEITEIVAGSGE
ncbi:MAG: ATP synthase F1 subunit gamma [Clostridia bacterium]|nr:ATP synthase F1 subunit gamma [Clostridia bacterium]